MILQTLYALAQREGLTEDLDFEPKPIAWLVRVSPVGKLIKIDGTHFIPPEEAERKKPRPIVKTFYVPREGGRTSGDKAFFLVDKAEYVFGIDPEGKRPLNKLKGRFNLFKGKVEACAAATQDKAIEAVREFLERVASGNQTLTLPDGCTRNDLFSFVLDSDLEIMQKQK